MKSQIEYPSKMYPTKAGDILSSQEYAETLKEAIEFYNNQIQKTRDMRKVKKLKDRLRSVKIWINQHDDVKQYFM
jgi:hypothetical protein